MNELLHFFVSLLLLAAYSLHLRRVAKNAPMTTARSAHAAIRSAWVKSVMGKPGSEILAVQTLRNSVMAASFMATTAVLAMSATLTLSGVGDSQSAIWEAARAGQKKEAIMAIKIILLASSFFISLLFMAMAVRFFNHTGYLVTVGTQADLERAQRVATAYLNRAGNHYSFGLRAFFTCIPLLAAIFNIWLTVPATLILIGILFWFDRIPSEESRA